MMKFFFLKLYHNYKKSVLLNKSILISPKITPKFKYSITFAVTNIYALKSNVLYLHKLLILYLQNSINYKINTILKVNHKIFSINRSPHKFAISGTTFIKKKIFLTVIITFQIHSPLITKTTILRKFLYIVTFLPLIPLKITLKKK